MLIGGALIVAGTFLLLLLGTDGYFESGTDHVAVDSSTIVASRQQVDRVRGLGDRDTELRIRIRATSREPAQDIFIGAASRSALAAYTAGAELDTVYDISVDPTKITIITCACVGSRPLEPPGHHEFWLASVSGPGEQELVWRPESDDDLVFVLNADASPALDADVSIGLRVEWLFRFALVGVLIGPVILLGGADMTRRGIRRRSQYAGEAHPPEDPDTESPRT